LAIFIVFKKMIPHTVSQSSDLGGIAITRLVNLTKRVEVNGELRFCPVVEAANGRIRPDVVYVNDKPETHREGTYYLDYREGEKRIRISVGKNAQDASAARDRRQAELNAVKAGATLADSPVTVGGQTKRSLRAAIDTYLDTIQANKKKKTHYAYKTSLTYFEESCHKLYVEDIERTDLLKFKTHLVTKYGLTDRTCWNKFSNVMSFLKDQGVSRVKDNHGQLSPLVKKDDWPTFAEKRPVIYEQGELDKLFAACTDEELIWFRFFDTTGMREQEVMHCSWSDIDFVSRTVTVRFNAEFGFSPKKYKEREIPIPEKTISLLKAWEAKSDKDCGLVFPTSGCRPKMDFIECLKRVAKRAGLNPSGWILHRFRATFATRALRNGVDLSTVQAWLGHSDLASTLRYLRPADTQAIRDKVDAMYG
jgi:integrase/recombinase XerD